MINEIIHLISKKSGKSKAIQNRKVTDGNIERLNRIIEIPRDSCKQIDVRTTSKLIGLD